MERTWKSVNSETDPMECDITHSKCDTDKSLQKLVDIALHTPLIVIVHAHTPILGSGICLFLSYGDTPSEV